MFLGNVFQSLNADENNKSLCNRRLWKKIIIFSETVTWAGLDRNMLPSSEANQRMTLKAINVILKYLWN